MIRSTSKNLLSLFLSSFKEMENEIQREREREYVTGAHQVERGSFLSWKNFLPSYFPLTFVKLFIRTNMKEWFSLSSFKRFPPSLSPFFISFLLLISGITHPATISLSKFQLDSSYLTWNTICQTREKVTRGRKKGKEREREREEGIRRRRTHKKIFLSAFWPKSHVSVNCIKRGEKSV